MKTSHLTALSAALVGVPLMAVTVALPASSVGAQTPPITVELLTPERSVFLDDLSVKFTVKIDGRRTRVAGPADASRVAVARIVVQPGARFPLHTHAGPVVVNVVQGELTYVDPETCSERAYPAGTAFTDTGDDVHSAFGSSVGPTTLIATFFGATPSGPLTIPETDQTTPSCP